jgi:hypothetical protein
MKDQVTPQEVAKSLPVPAAWAATFGIDPETYWRDNAQLTACERGEMQDAADWIVEQAEAYEPRTADWVDMGEGAPMTDAGISGVEYADDEIDDDQRFTLPGYDPDDFTDG